MAVVRMIARKAMAERTVVENCILNDWDAVLEGIV